MERMINKLAIAVIGSLVLVDILTHGAVSQGLANTFFGGKGFFATLARLISGQAA